MPRKERSDKGKSRENYHNIARKRTPNNTGKTYNIKPVEQRGKQPREFRVQIAFWRKYTMDEVITWTPEELEQKIEDFYTAFETRQIKHNINWWYPEDPKNRAVDMLKAK